MTAADRLDEIEARANAAREVPWEWHVTEDRRWTYVTGANGTVIEHMADDDDADFIVHARTDVPALVAALRAVLDLHREARNDVDHTPPCPHCHGEPGIHECGCWADEKWPTVCAVCMEGTKGASVAWPCPTVRVIEEALS